MNRMYIAIDMKSFYASVECVQRRLDPLTAYLLVADESRTDKTICLAVSPALKAIGVPGRPRLFEAKEIIRQYERLHNVRISYITAVPQMERYEQVSAQIYAILLRYVLPEHVHVYSIDESFIDCTDYLHLFASAASAAGVSAAHQMAMTIIRDVLRATGITATVGIGTNLYLAKVAMDIVAKKSPPDQDGVRIAELDEKSYCRLLWRHTPLTDFWQIGPGKAARLQQAAIYTMGDIAVRSLQQEEWFYQQFGIDAEILIDHAWGIEPVEISDIKNYQADSRSLSVGQVLTEPYPFQRARIVFQEMVEGLCCDLLSRHLACSSITWYAAYDPQSLEVNSDYRGPVCADYYGRLHPRHSNGTVPLPRGCRSPRAICAAVLRSFDQKADTTLLFRRLNVAADRIQENDCVAQLELFGNIAAEEKELRLQQALQGLRQRFGPNVIFNGYNMQKGATALVRSEQIGGHRKGASA